MSPSTWWKCSLTSFHSYVTAHNSQDPNSAIANTGARCLAPAHDPALISRWRPGADILIEDIQDTRQMLADMGLTGKVQVGNSDAGFYFNTKVLEAIDYGVNLNCWSSPLDADTIVPCNQVVQRASLVRWRFD